MFTKLIKCDHAMHGICLSHIVFLLFQAIQIVSSQTLYGASVNWRPTSNNSIALTYRFIWENSWSLYKLKNNACSRFQPLSLEIEGCEKRVIKDFQNGNYTVHDIGTVNGIFSGNRLICTNGCNVHRRVLSNLSELYFTETSSFLDNAWESGVGTVDVRFSDLDSKDNIRIGLISADDTLVYGLSEAQLSMAWRNDTMRPNISPLLNVFPVYSVPLACSISIRLFPFDGDGDRVVCHWEKCPDTNSHESLAVLNSHACEIVFVADDDYFKQGDVIYLSLYAEDYSDFPIELHGASRYVSSGPFCSTPIKLRVSIGYESTACQSKGPLFDNEQTLRPYFKRSYEAGNLKGGITTYIPFTTSDQHDIILTSGPRYMTFTIERNITLVTNGLWNDVHDDKMKGIHQVCGMVYSDDGLPGESRCVILLISEPDECNVTKNPCGEGGICGNFFEHYTCSYEFINITYIKSLNENCNSGTTIEKGDNGLKIGLPVGLTLLLLPILIAVTLYLKHKWSEKMQRVDVGEETSVLAVARRVFRIK